MKNVKTIFALAFLSGSLMISSQVIIGDDDGTAAVKTSVLLEFANTGDKGIILPYVTSKKTATAPVAERPTEGTIILDASPTGGSRIKYYNGVTSSTNTEGWVDLSGQNGNVSAELLQQPSLTEDTKSKAIIGAASSTADGVLVLESTTKAMVLPIVESTNDVKSPSPGMMVYIKKSGAKRLAVYNGSKWSYWKP